MLAQHDASAADTLLPPNLRDVHCQVIIYTSSSSVDAKHMGHQDNPWALEPKRVVLTACIPNASCSTPFSSSTL